jgi:hypothetical protein
MTMYHGLEQKRTRLALPLLMVMAVVIVKLSNRYTSTQCPWDQSHMNPLHILEKSGLATVGTLVALPTCVVHLDPSLF